MEAIKDIDQHMLCTADPYRGIIEHANRKDKILIYLPIGGEVSRSQKKRLIQSFAVKGILC